MSMLNVSLSVCVCVCDFTFAVYFHESLYEYYVIGHHNTVSFIFLHSVIRTWGDAQIYEV
jgi:hypothetical protein